MTILKILFLLLIAVPFALFLLYILDRLMDEMPSKAEQEAEMSPVERRRSRAAARNRSGSARTVNHRQNAPSAAEKRRRRKARKTQRKQQRKTDRS